MADNMSYVIYGALAAILLAGPALAQEIDMSAFDTFLTSLLDALTGTTGRVLMTIVAIGVLIAGTLNFMDWGRVLTFFVVVVAIGVIPTVIQSIWGTA